MSAFLIPAPSVEQALFLAPGQTSLPRVQNSPFHNLLGLSRTDLAASRELEAAERRLLTKRFVRAFQWSTVYSLLPLQLAVPQEVSPWRPRPCRSYYRWLPPKETLAAANLQGLDDFDLVLRLFDFSAHRTAFFRAWRGLLHSPGVRTPRPAL